MAKYNRVSDNLRKAKEFNDISFNSEIGINNTLKTMNKQRISRELYNWGIQWFDSGKALKDATEVVAIEGGKSALKDVIYFQRGYEAGLNREGFNMGYDGISLSEISDNYTSNRYFLEGYKDGMLKREKVESKKTR